MAIRVTYARSMGVAFVAHCLLNQNSKVGDGAHCAGVYSPVDRRAAGEGLADRADALPRARVHRAEPVLGGEGAARHGGLPAALRAARRGRRRGDQRAGHQGEDVVLVGVEGSPSMGVTITSSDPLRGGRPEWPDGTSEHVSGEGIFVEETRQGARQPRDRLPPGRGRDARAPRPRRGRADGPGSPYSTQGGLMKRDERSFRVVLVADGYVNPPPGGMDGDRRAAQTGWGVMQLPADDYPARGRASGSWPRWPSRSEEFSRHGYDFVLVGERDGLAEALARVGLRSRTGSSPRALLQLREFLDGRPSPQAASRDRPGRRLGSGARLQLAGDEREPGRVGLAPARSSRSAATPRCRASWWRSRRAPSRRRCSSWRAHPDRSRSAPRRPARSR